MKIKKFPFLLLIVFCLFGCKKEQILATRGERILKVNDYNKVNLDGNVVLNVHYTTNQAGDVKINTGDHDWANVNISSGSGELVVRVDENIKLTENITVDIYVPVITAIRLQNKQEAIVNFDNEFNIFDLDIITEAESKLQLYNLNVNNITSRQEATSEVFISSAIAAIISPVDYTGKVTIINNNTIVVDGQFLIQADSIHVNNYASPVTYTVYGNAKGYNLIGTASFRGEAKSTIEISDMPVAKLDMKMEGTSIANVWALETLTGKGAGNSVLNYSGNPNSTYVVTGSAQVVNRP